MKRSILFSWLLLSFSQHLCGIISTDIPVPEDTRQVIIHFTQVPNDEHHHKKLNEVIEESLSLVNKKLIDDGWISVPPKKLTADAGTIARIKYTVLMWYHTLFHRTHTLKYPKKENRAFFTRTDKDLGLYTMHIPDGVPYQVFVKYLKEIYAQKAIIFHIDPDVPVHITQRPDIGLEGKALTFEELEQFKKPNLMKKNEQELAELEKKPTKSTKEQQKIKQLSSGLEKYKAIKDALFWHYSFPTTGLLLKEPFYPPAYPYLPHFFSLWQLAPNKGNGVNTAVIDTGVAAYEVKDDPAHKKNRDLLVKQKPGTHTFNIVSENGLDPIEQLILLIKPYIDKNKFNQEYLESIIPDWIKAYLQQKDDQPIKNYLVQNGIKELVDAKGNLTKKGKKALSAITTGRYGINPKDAGVQRPFIIKELKEPYTETIVSELLPVPRITKQRTTFVAGHGSHTFGLIAAQQQNNGTSIDPEKDTGVVGLAPNANAFMIKAFKDNGVSDKSTLIAAIKKSIVHNADVVNLSLKIADNLDLTNESTKLLERIVNLVPYLVAASGNNGDSRFPGYAGKVEAYPARFASVPFDVGAFAYKNGKAYITPFSQYEPGVGPLFVAPGFDILSTGLIPGQTVNSEYVFMAGTSMATPIMAGFVTLLLGEFKDKFTREQLLKVCYTSTLKLQNDDNWKTKVILGVVDMRTALFVLHALDRFRTAIKKGTVSFDFDKKFDHALQAVLTIVFAQPKEYAKKYLDGADFKTDFMTYFNTAQTNKDKLNKKEFFMPEGDSALDQAFSYVVNTLLAALSAKNISKPKGSAVLIKEVAGIFKSKTVDLLPGIDKKIKDRLTKKETEKYWTDKAEKLKLIKGQNAS